MADTFPNDADGDALRRVAERSDMSQPMDIDFAINVPNQARGENRTAFAPYGLSREDEFVLRRLSLARRVLRIGDYHHAYGPLVVM